MLPNLPLATNEPADPPLDYSQQAEFPLGIAGAMFGGACLGLALLWLACVKRNRRGDFLADSRRPRNVVAIESVYASTVGRRQTGMMRLLQQGEWVESSRIASIAPPLGGTQVLATSVTTALANCSGYFIFGFFPPAHAAEATIGHAVALAVAPQQPGPCHFFDPNLGDGKFASRQEFLVWFSSRYWFSLDGPGAHPGCGSFHIDKLLPDVSPPAPAPAPDLSAPVKWDPSKGPPPPISRRKPGG